MTEQTKFKLHFQIQIRKRLTFHTRFAFGPVQMNHASSTNSWTACRSPNLVVLVTS